MPVRVRAIPPGEFIRNHLRDVGGIDYIQAVHKDYKAYLLSVGLRNGSTRESMSKYFWLARKLGLIVFDHAEAVAYWDAQVNVTRVPRNYQPFGRPRTPNPRHYYRLVDENDPRWVRLEASYRESIGIPVPPAMPRVPWEPKPALYPMGTVPIEEEITPPVEEAAPIKKPRIPKAAKVPKPAKSKTAQEVLIPFEARVDRVTQALGQLAKTPDIRLANAIEAELIALSGDAAKAALTAKGVTQERLLGIVSVVRTAADDYPLVLSSLRSWGRETLPARQRTALGSLQAAIRVVSEGLSGYSEAAG